MPRTWLNQGIIAQGVVFGQSAPPTYPRLPPGGSIDLKILVQSP